MIKDIYESTGASIRQLGWVLGIWKAIIEKTTKEDEQNVFKSYRKYKVNKIRVATGGV